METIIHQPGNNTAFEKTIRLHAHKGSHINLEIVGEGHTLDAHRARQLYNAIGAEMGFDKPAKTRAPSKGAQAYKGNGKHKWELVTSDAKEYGHTYRLRVPGGWLYRTVTTLPSLVGDEADPVAQSTVFVPVPDAVGYSV